MLATIICVVLAIACLTAGAVEGAIALGILAAILYFFFGSKSASGNTKNPQPKPKQESKPQPASQHRATPSMIVHYRSSPVVAQIVQELRGKGAVERISIPRGGHELSALGGSPYRYVFKDHGYQPLSLQEQEAFLVAIVEQLPHAETYKICYEHYENETTPLHFYANTSYYRDNQYRWNRDTGAWEKLTKL